MIIRMLTFSDNGEKTAEKLCKAFMKTDTADFMRCGETVTLEDWTSEAFERADALIFIGACGIAVRAVAPFVKSKISDPAVVVVDELGHFAISLLSGHLGGANDLTRRVAAVIGAEPVITTATDINSVFAIDEWARYQDCVIFDPEKIKDISSRLLNGGSIRIKSNFPIAGKEPDQVSLSSEDSADVHVSTRRSGIFGGRGGFDPMVIIPHIAVLGIGCKKGTPKEAIEKCFKKITDELDIFDDAFFLVCSVDLKKNERGIKDFCREHDLKFETYSSKELLSVPGEFTSSGFVEEITGVDNVCERSAVRGAGDGRLVLKKTVWESVTMAVAFRNISLDWRYKDE